jgi:hypothetical protein
MILSHHSEGICILLDLMQHNVIGKDMDICSVYAQAMFKAKGKSRVYESNPLVMDS